MNNNYLVAYKMLNNNMQDEKRDFVFEIGKWYRTIDIDMSSKEDSFGLSAFYDPFSIFLENEDIYIVHISKDFRIKHLEDGFIRCECLKIVEKLPVHQEVKQCWHLFNSNQRKRVIRYLKDFDYQSVWNTFSDDEKNDCVYFTKNFDYIKYWNELTDLQKNIFLKKKDFEYKRFWKQLSEDQKEVVILNNLNFEHEVCWHTLSERLQNAVVKSQNNVPVSDLLKKKIVDNNSEYWKYHEFTKEELKNLSYTEKQILWLNNKYIDFDSIWKSSKEKGKSLLLRNEYFPFEKYWSELKEDQRDQVIISNKNIDLLWKYFDDFTTNQKQLFAYRTYVTIGE